MKTRKRVKKVARAPAKKKLAKKIPPKKKKKLTKKQPEKKSKSKTAAKKEAVIKSLKKLRGFKFYPPTQNALLALANSSIWMSHPEKFNDPFDSILRYDSTDNVNFRKAAAKALKKHLPKVENDPFFKERISRWISVIENDNFEIYYSFVKEWHDEKRLPAEVWEEIQTSIGIPSAIKFMDSCAKKMGVFAICKTWNNSLLWAHYTSNHTGFCVEYDLESAEHIEIHKVTYNNKMPEIIDPEKLKVMLSKQKEIHNNLMKQVTWKDDNWKYEEEYRLVSFKFSNQLVKIPGKITRVIFGYRSSPELRKTVMTLIGTSVDYRIIDIDDGSYALNIKNKVKLNDNPIFKT